MEQEETNKNKSKIWQKYRRWIKRIRSVHLGVHCQVFQRFQMERIYVSLVRKILAIHLGYLYQRITKNDQFWTISLQRVHGIFVLHLGFHWHVFRRVKKLVRKILTIHLGYAKNDQFWTICLQQFHALFDEHLEFHSPSCSICLGYHCPRSSKSCF